MPIARSKREPRPVVKLTRTVRFSSAHRYWRPEWPAERNQATFGSNTGLHGHNYLVEVTASGVVDAETGFSVDLMALDRALEIEVGQKLGSRDLSEGVEGLADKIPTTENVAVLVWERLAAALAGAMVLERVRVYESAELFVDYEGKREKRRADTRTTASRAARTPRRRRP